MAGLPALTAPAEPARISRKEDKERAVYAQLIFNGNRPHEIAKVVHPEDKTARKHLRGKLRRWCEADRDFQARVVEIGHGEMVMSLGQALQALGRRAGRGNPAAMKLLLEASGFHNPKVKHEHSGDIAVKIEGMLRPPIQEDEDQVVDAEVVEDD